MWRMLRFSMCEGGREKLEADSKRDERQIKIRYGLDDSQ